MGMHFGLIAARAELDAFRVAFFAAWPNLEIVEVGQGFASGEELSAWQESTDLPHLATTVAVKVVDRTDYSEVVSRLAARTPTKSVRKPWWKFW